MENIDIYLKSLAENLKGFKDHSLINGSGGAILYLIYYGRATNQQKYLARAIELLQQAIEHFAHNNKSKSTFGYGFIGVAWLTQFLNNEGILSRGDISFLDEIDEVIFESLIAANEEQNYDLFAGSIGCALYFVERKNAMTTLALNEFIGGLEMIHQKDEFGIKWPDFFKPIDTDIPEYNLGMAHGSPSIVSFLCSAFEYIENKEKVIVLIQKTISWIRHYKQDVSFGSYYPSIISDRITLPQKSALSWCYGDLGIAFSFIKAGELLNDNSLIEEAYELVLNAATRDMKDSLIFHSKEYHEACFCHGSAGNSYMFMKLFSYFKDKKIQTAQHYWFKQFSELRLKMSNRFSFYSYNEQDELEWNDDLTILEGISGIGLVLLAKLHVNCQNWDKVFLLDI
ncbi:lanthionine synthetase LanC family protein [Fulvivirga sp. M361]|uniref:lanthionine synthetase LanC family protein n=1 Tax=Fulvivirga sp. M361 TaxID=2594266 RepID=UPI0016277DAC|nr:lanthionine synthetase LanC family protein [Fulvivirga sp. M361]